MHSAAQHLTLVGVLAGSLCIVFAQSVPAPAPSYSERAGAAAGSEAQEGLTSSIPTVRVEFKPKGTIPGTSSSPAILMPFLCGPDGTAFAAVPQPPNYQSEVIYSLSQGGSHAFSYGSAPGLYDVHYLSFFPGHSMVGILVHATTDPKTSQYSVVSPNGAASKTGTGYRGEHHDYILEFDRDGNYKKTVELPEEYSFHRFAELSDGKFLAVGYDRVNAVARLFLLDSDGQIIRPVQIPERMQDDPQLTQGETGGALNRARAETSLSWWLFAPARDRILLYLARSKAPVLEVGADGTGREVHLETPPGYLLDGVVSSSDRWLFRYRREGLPDRGSTDRRPETRDFVLYEVNPSDGSLESEIEAVGVPGFGTACEQDGVLSGFSVSPDNKYLLMTADIPR